MSEESKIRWQILWAFLLYAAVAVPMMAAAERIIPPWPLVFGTDEDGERFDRRSYLASLLAIPVAFIIGKGIQSIRRDGIGDAPKNLRQETGETKTNSRDAAVLRQSPMDGLFSLISNAAFDFAEGLDGSVLGAGGNRKRPYHEAMVFYAWIVSSHINQGSIITKTAFTERFLEIEKGMGEYHVEPIASDRWRQYSTLDSSAALSVFARNVMDRIGAPRSSKSTVVGAAASRIQPLVNAVLPMLGG